MFSRQFYYSNEPPMYSQLYIIVCLTIWQIGAFVMTKDADDGEICESEDCKKTANHILKWLNPEADPCEDFYEFACGNWKNLAVEERAQMSLGARDSLEKRFIPILLKDPSTTNGNKYFDKLRNFMISCIDTDTIRSLGVTPIKQLIKKAGGWPVLDADWSEENWDFVNAEVTLGGVLIAVDTTYHKAENSTGTTYLIEVGPSSLIRNGLENEPMRAYFNRIVDVAVTLGADKAVAEQAMNKVLVFDTLFAEELRNISYLDKKPVTLNQFEEAVPWIKTLIGGYLPESLTLLPEEEIITKKEFFLVLENMASQFSPETFVNYMVIKAVLPLMEYIFSEGHQFEGQDSEESRINYCINIVTEGSLGPAMVAYLGTMYTNDSKVAVEMAKAIKEELTKEVETLDWLDDFTREETAKNTSEIKIYVGFPPRIVDLDELDTIYEGYETDTSTFFDAIMNDKKWIKRREFDKLHKNTTKPEELHNLGWRLYTNKSLQISAHFIPNENAIEVSGPMLYFAPLFGYGNPAYVNYGHAGIFMAHELIHAVDVNAEPSGGYLLEMERWRNNQSEFIYEQKKQCFIDFYSSINDTKFTQMKLNGNFTQREDIADNGGLKLSLRAYRKLAEQLGSPERKLPRLQQYSIEQLFMISTANFFCEIPFKDSRVVQLEYSRHSPFEFRVNGIMMNSPDFSEIFHCDERDHMNPSHKCEVW